MGARRRASRRRKSPVPRGSGREKARTLRSRSPRQAEWPATMRLSRDPAARRRLAALGAAAAAALVIGIAVGSGARDTDDEGGGEAAEPSAPAEAEGERRQVARRAVDRLSLRRQVGQLLISSFDETTLPDYMHRRLRARETAGVILFSRNGGDEAHWRALTRSIQDAAGGRALVMVDPEGGDIRTADFAG